MSAITDVITIWVHLKGHGSWHVYFAYSVSAPASFTALISKTFYQDQKVDDCLQLLNCWWHIGMAWQTGIEVTKRDFILKHYIAGVYFFGVWFRFSVCIFYRCRGWAFSKVSFKCYLSSPCFTNPHILSSDLHINSRFCFAIEIIIPWLLQTSRPHFGCSLLPHVSKGFLACNLVSWLVWRMAACKLVSD